MYMNGKRAAIHDTIPHQRNAFELFGYVSYSSTYQYESY